MPGSSRCRAAVRLVEAAVLASIRWGRAPEVMYIVTHLRARVDVEAVCLGLLVCPIQYARPSSCVRASLPFVFIFHVLVMWSHGHAPAPWPCEPRGPSPHAGDTRWPSTRRSRVAARAGRRYGLIARTWRGHSREKFSTPGCGDVSAHVRLFIHVILPRFLNQHQHSTCRANTHAASTSSQYIPLHCTSAHAMLISHLHILSASR